MSKPKVIKDYKKLDDSLLMQIKRAYPHGFKHHLIKFTNQKGKYVSALPFETEDREYLVKMTVHEAQKFIEDDEDYDDLGVLKAMPQTLDKELDKELGEAYPADIKDVVEEEE